jgi:hypothetical protein
MPPSMQGLTTCSVVAGTMIIDPPMNENGRP